MEIQTKSLGRTGLEVSKISFGTWRFGRVNDKGNIEIKEDKAYDLLDTYEQYSGNFIDTADKYGDGKSEEWIGNWLTERDREDYVIASKVGRPRRYNDPNGSGLNRKHIRRQINKTLKRLNTDYLDILYAHRWDDQTPVREFMYTFNNLVQDGKVNYLGISSFEPDAWKIVKSIEVSNTAGYEPFKIVQPRYNILDKEIEFNYLDMCEDYDLAVVSWSPLAWGFLTGKYDRHDRTDDSSRAVEDDRFESRYFHEEHFNAVDLIEKISQRHDCTAAQISLAWLQHKEAIPIVGARTIQQLEENLESNDVSLSDTEVRELSNIVDPKWPV